MGDPKTHSGKTDSLIGRKSADILGRAEVEHEFSLQSDRLGRKVGVPLQGEGLGQEVEFEEAGEDGLEVPQTHFSLHVASVVISIIFSIKQ